MEPVDYVAGLNFVRTLIERHFIELLLDVGRSSQMSTQRENYAITNSGEGVWEAVQGGKNVILRTTWFSNEKQMFIQS